MHATHVGADKILYDKVIAALSNSKVLAQFKILSFFHDQAKDGLIVMNRFMPLLEKFTLADWKAFNTQLKAKLEKIRKLKKKNSAGKPPTSAAAAGKPRKPSGASPKGGRFRAIIRNLERKIRRDLNKLDAAIDAVQQQQ